jgi:hypothetical protein
MSARDELAEEISGHPIGLGYYSTNVGLIEAREMADILLAAGYRKPLTIENDKLVIDDGLLLLEVGSCTCTPYGSSHENGCGYEFLDDLTKPLERAGYRKPRTITKAEELDALPNGSVVIADLTSHHSGGWPLAYQRWEDGAWHRGARAASTHPDYIVPATVLHEPAVTS